MYANGDAVGDETLKITQEYVDAAIEKAMPKPVAAKKVAAKRAPAKRTAASKRVA